MSYFTVDRERCQACKLLYISVLLGFSGCHACVDCVNCREEKYELHDFCYRDHKSSSYSRQDWRRDVSDYELITDCKCR